MANEQPRLLATPAGHDDAQQADQRAEELAIQLDLLLLLSGLCPVGGCGSDPFGALRGVARRGSLLLLDGMSYAVYEGEKEGDVDGARYPGSVLEIEGGELGNDSLDGVISHREHRLRLVRRHYTRRSTEKAGRRRRRDGGKEKEQEVHDWVVETIIERRVETVIGVVFRLTVSV